MKDHVPHWRDDQRARDRATQLHRLRDEKMREKSRSTWRRRAIAGVLIGSFGYLLTSCYIDQRLHQPKIDRVQFRFGHGPWPY